MNGIQFMNSRFYRVRPAVSSDTPELLPGHLASGHDHLCPDHLRKDHRPSRNLPPAPALAVQPLEEGALEQRPAQDHSQHRLLRERGSRGGAARPAGGEGGQGHRIAIPESRQALAAAGVLSSLSIFRLGHNVGDPVSVSWPLRPFPTM